MEFFYKVSDTVLLQIIGFTVKLFPQRIIQVPYIGWEFLHRPPQTAGAFSWELCGFPCPPSAATSFQVVDTALQAYECVSLDGEVHGVMQGVIWQYRPVPEDRKENVLRLMAEFKAGVEQRKRRVDRMRAPRRVIDESRAPRGASGLVEGFTARRP